MEKLFYLVANGMAAFMDFALGCLIAVVVALVMGHPISWWEPIVAGAVFSLLPDYDVLIPILVSGLTGRKFVHNHHESFLHWPFLIIPVIVTVTLLFFGSYWYATGTLCVLAHYIHDAVMMKGDGVGWFFRLYPKYWSRRGKTEPADPDHRHWVKANWLNVSMLSVIEVIVGSLAAGLAIGLLAYSWSITEESAFILGLVTTDFILLSVLLFWKLAQVCKFA